jgi:hypothetical protein
LSREITGNYKRLGNSYIILIYLFRMLGKSPEFEVLAGATHLPTPQIGPSSGRCFVDTLLLLRPTGKGPEI